MTASDEARAKAAATYNAAADPLPSADAWWAAVLGTSYRGTVEQLNAHDRERVRVSNVNFIRESGIRSVETNAVYAIATKACQVE